MTNRLFLAPLAAGILAATTLAALAKEGCVTPFGNEFCYRQLPLDVCTMDLMDVEDDDTCIVVYQAGQPPETGSRATLDQLEAAMKAGDKGFFDKIMKNSTIPTKRGDGVVPDPDKVLKSPTFPESE